MDGLIEALHRMPLFEALSAEQLRWLAEHGTIVEYAAGELVFAEGTPADTFYVLIDGAMHLTKRINGHELDLVTADQPGAWAGYLPMLGETNRLSLRVPRPTRLLRFPAESITYMLNAGFPIATHLLAGIFAGTNNLQTLVRQHEKLASLGRLAAGLAHELNNPASAARRAASQLRRATAARVDATLELDHVLPGWREQLGAAEREVLERLAAAPPAAPLEVADREDAINRWLRRRGIPECVESTPVLAEAGLAPAWLDGLAERVPAGALAPAVRWLVASVTAAWLIDEVERSAARISSLVQAVSAYTYMDQAPLQEVDVRAALETTLAVLGAKLRAMRVESDYAPDLPPVLAYGGELNQVWTHLIINAVEATRGRGTLRIRTWREDDLAVVEIADDGPGIPEDALPHIFEPFFTTKPPGEGAGLGLDISYRIVVNQHGGDIRAISEPGDTRFQVRLPFSAAAAAGGAAA